jgi:dihydroorotate dehydrogenase electron transfer subunit
MSKFLEQTKILDNQEIAKSIFKCRFATKEIYKTSLPGNFLNISIIEPSAHLLKRPFGIYNIQNNEIEIVYRVRGKVTQRLSDLKAGNLIEVLGPLGNNFTVPKNKKILILAGGLGVAPLFFLEKHLSKENEIVFVYGAKNEKELIKINTKNLINHLDNKENCFVCDKLDFLLQKNKIEKLYTCGPEILMEKSYNIAKKYSIPTEVSLEARMACGFGACVGCTIETKNGLKKVCVDGPVFDAKNIWG